MRVAIHPTAPNRGCCFIVKILGSSEKFVGNFLGSLAQYSSVHTGMTKVVLFGNIC